MKNKAAKVEIKGDFCDYGNDFQVLPAGERRGILRAAKTLLKEQNKVKSLLAAAGSAPSPREAGKAGR